MVCKGQEPLCEIPINGTYILGIYKGTLSEFDILLKYRQKEDEQKPKDENKQSLPTMTNTQKEAKKENAPVNPPSSTNSTNQTNNDLFAIFNTKGNNAQPVSPETNQQMPKIDSTCNNISILFS